MTTRLLILLAAALLYWAAPAQGQTIKSLGYNTTNGEVVYTNGSQLTFTNSVNFSFLGDGSATGFVGRNGGALFLYGTNVTTSVPAFYGWSGFANTAMSAGLARTNLGLGSGITTNVTFVDAATNTNSVTISNGIITGWTQ
jgi:hypothetical protein